MSKEMSAVLSQVEPPKDTHAWVYWILCVVGGGGVAIITKLAKMIKTADEERIASLEEQTCVLQKEAAECREDRESLGIRVAKLEATLIEDE